MANQTIVSEFLLLEFSKVRELQILHFIVFLVLYLAIITGNFLIISAVVFDRHLHTPMYFFVMNLAMQDIGTVSVIMPNSMVNSLMNTRHISYYGCIFQLFFFLVFLGSDFFLLIVMAYDRYVAICNPLHYERIMNQTACIQMVGTVWICGLIYGILHTGGTFASPLCSNIVNQFFCEIPPLLKLACSELYFIEVGFVLLSVVMMVCCFVFVIITYVRILTTVLRIPSVQGRKKAFSTCAPHLIVFCTFIASTFFVHLKPRSDAPSYLDLTFSIIYAMVPSMMNPVIYSMRNKDIRIALSKLLTVQ